MFALYLVYVCDFKTTPLANTINLVSQLRDKHQSHEDNKPHTGGVILLLKAYEENCQGGMSV
jgi:UDP-N-acetylmuramyl pentapeptide phosphotransferase/UDP-N-acetylglucosamine-1-phosphate transferase